MLKVQIKGLGSFVSLCLIIHLSAQPVKNTQLTVYNNDLGLIRQTREVILEKKSSEIRIVGISAQVDPTSVRLTFPQLQGEVTILEQNYLYDLVSSRRIFQKYIGESIIYHLEDGTQLSGKILSVEGRNLILALPEGGIRIASGKSIMDYEFPSLPEGLILTPTLQWQVQSRHHGRHIAELSYLTGGLSWHAEYILILSENETDLSLAAWVSLNNESGATYADATMKLIAGDIHRARDERERQHAVMAFKAAVEAEQPFAERELFDYHLYELQWPVTLKNNEIKQVTLFEEVYSRGEKIYLFQGNSTQEYQALLRVVLRIPNTQSNQMGFPIPRGVVRIFKRDVDQTLQLIGEDNIGHTAKQDTLALTVGNAFDVRGEKHITDRKRNKNSETISVKIILYNRKDQAVQAEVQEFHRGDWYLQRASHDYQQKSNRQLVFPLTLKANSSDVITYTFTREW